MHAVQISEVGGPEVLKWAEVPSPLPGPGELVVSDSVVAGLEATAAVFQAVGPARVKGVQAPVWLHRFAAPLAG